MKLHYVIFAAATSGLLFSCVSSKKFKTAQAQYGQLQVQYTALQGDLTNCNNANADLNRKNSTLENDKTSLNNRIADLNKQVDLLRENNTSALKQLQDMSVISSSQAESIKKSLDNIGAKDTYIQTLQQQMAHKDSIIACQERFVEHGIGDEFERRYR